MSDNRDYTFEDIHDSSHNEEDFYAKFKERLKDVQKFPAEYVFKFIYPSSEETMNKIKDVFLDQTVDYSYKASANRKYTSISAKIFIDEADVVINYYKDVAKIEGVIML
ncbi:MAG: DUF493 family protein [Algoriella sp.]|uniref:DUF493 family protein n=1 Tax=Algoriella sp. TaxID=1872434 RepID=UPI002FCA5809